MPPPLLLQPGGAPLAGRVAELGLLQTLLISAGEGHTRFALLCGPPGVGKTRLLRELTARAQTAGWRALVGGAEETRSLSPYQPFVEALRPELDARGPGAARRIAGRWTSHLARLLPELAPDYPTSAGDDRAALLEACAQVLRALCRHHPLLLVLDDLQWADAACLELLLYLARRLRDVRLLILAAYRDTELEASLPLQALLADLSHLRLAAELRLEPLDQPTTTVLLQGLLGGLVTPRLAILVQHESEGNPFFAEELLRGLSEQGQLIPPSPSLESGGAEEVKESGNQTAWDVTPGAVPRLTAGAHQALRARFRRLPAPTYHAVQAAAILGRRFHLDVLAAMIGVDPPDAAQRLREAQRRGLIQTDPEAESILRFGHDRLREALAQDLEPEARRQLHERAAAALGQIRGEVAGPEIAYHMLRGPHPGQALPHLLRAAERARAAGAFQDAAAHFALAVELLRATPSPYQDNSDSATNPLAETLLLLGEVQAAEGRYEPALAAYGEALRLLPSGSVAAELRERQGAIHLAREEPQLAERSLLAALEWCEQTLIHTPMEAPAPVVWNRLLGGEQPPPMPSSSRPAHRDLELRRARLLLLLGQLDVAATGQLEQGEQRLERARVLAARLQEPRLESESLSLLGQAAMHRGDFARGRERFLQALALAEHLDAPRLTALAGDGLARLCYWTADFHTLRQYAERDLALAGRGADPGREGWPLFWLTQATLNQGELRPAGRHAQALQRLGDELGLRRFQAQGHQLRGLVALQRGDADRALAEIEQAVALFHTIGPGALVYYLGPLAQVHIRLGQLAQAQATLDEVLSLAYRFSLASSPRVQACNVAALALLELGQIARALALEPELLPAEGQLHWYLVGRTLGLLALASGRLELADARLARARAQAIAGGGRLELARTVAADAELAARRGDLAHSAELAASAANMFRTLGAQVEPPPVPPEPRPSPGPALPGNNVSIKVAGLSPRELQVLRLVAAGRTNREIAVALVISEKTAINHLTHIFAKLCLHLHGRARDDGEEEHREGRCLNRAALAAFAIREGLA